jgi:uncharacterized membrane protein
MHKGRLEAFSDGVFAIIITIMVLELRAPAGSDLAALRPLVPVLFCYLLSFANIGIYWSNHHHLFQAVHRVDGRILWANLHLLFWLSLLPFCTAWMGQNPFAAWPTALYGIDLIGAAVAYYLLSRALVALEGQESELAIAIGGDFKGRISLFLYAVAILLAFVSDWAALVIYTVVAIMWIIPDRRIERTLSERQAR